MLDIYPFNLLLFECREFDYDFFRLHHFEFVEIDVANSLVPQLNDRVTFRAFCKHGQFHLVRIENEHSALSSSARNESALFFNETTTLVESYLHALFNNLADRDQILHDGRNMQDILNVSLLTFFAEWNIANVPNQVRSVISGFDIAGSLRLSKFSKPFLMRCHMVRGIGVNEPYILRIGGTSRSRGRHRIFSMSHHEHSAMVFIV